MSEHATVETATVEATPETGTRARRQRVKGSTGRTAKNLKGGKSNVAQSDKEILAEKEATLRKKYKSIVEGSIRRHTNGQYAGKITVSIQCATKGCGNTRTVATSDLFQVRYCEKCTEERRQARRRKNGKAKAE
jgi:hypothetical protein